MIATIYFYCGYGMETRIIEANNYNELVEKTNTKIEYLKNKVFKFFNTDEGVKAIIDKVVYKYPSGKIFIKKF